MIGNNDIEFNQATMIEAVQEYLSARFNLGEGRKLTVTKIALKATGSTSYDTASPTFLVSTSTEQSPKVGSGE